MQGMVPAGLELATFHIPSKRATTVSAPVVKKNNSTKYLINFYVGIQESEYSESLKIIFL